MKKQIQKNKSNKKQSVDKHGISKETHITEQENYVAEYKYCERYEDNIGSTLPHIGSGRLSVCKISSDMNGKQWLKRYADINAAGEIRAFYKDKAKPLIFYNRDMLFLNASDGIFQDGTIGVWKWTATTNRTDSSSDYIESKFIPDLMPIEVVRLPGYDNVNTTIAVLKKGIKKCTTSKRIIFCVCDVTGVCKGLLCSEKDLVNNGEIIRLSDKVTKLPEYIFYDNDIVKVSIDYSVYAKITAGIPNRMVFTKTPQETTKQLILDSISWSLFKEYGGTRNAYREYRGVLENIPVSSIKDRISNELNCPKTKAKELVDDFFKHVAEYLDGKSFDDDVIFSAISANDELKSRAIELVKANWEKEHSEKIKEAEKELEQRNKQIHLLEAELKQKENALENLNLKISSSSEILVQKEKLATDMEIAVANRIKKAKENMAEFLADTAMYGSLLPGRIEEKIEKRKALYNVIHSDIDRENMDKFAEWSEVQDELMYNLEEAGVSREYSGGLASYLCAAYILKQPIMLVGSNGSDIIKAFSATINHNQMGILECNGEYDTDCLPDKLEPIVEIRNILSANWTIRLPEIIAARKSFFIATHPFAEDIQVEPRGLHDFMLPVFTEFVIENISTNDFWEGYLSDDFKEYAVSDKIEKKIVPAKIKITPLARKNIDLLGAVINEIDREFSIDDCFLFLIFPYLYATLQIRSISDITQYKDKGGQISKNMMKLLAGILDEE